MAVESNTLGVPGLGKRLALVVGVNQVPRSLLPALRSASKDAEAVARVLEAHCHFTLLEPPLLEERATSTEVKKAILRLAHSRGANDFLLLYFSGHGTPMDVEAGRNVVYLGTHDFAEEEVAGDETLHLSLPWLRDKLYLQTEAGKVVLLLDCCYSGLMGRTAPDPYLKELQQRISYYFDAPGAQSGARSGGLRLALTATGHNAVAQEGQEHGHMTGLVLPALRGEVPEVLGRQGQLTLTRLFDYLQERYEELGIPQPSLSGDIAGQYCILASFQARHISRSAPLPVLAQPGRPKNYLPIPRNPFFQPRPGEFEQLERLLFAAGTPQHPVRLGLVGVTGMGGVGKTQLAAELAYRYQHHFPGGIFWMPATGQRAYDWQHTLADLAVKMDFLPPGDDPAHPEYEARRARHLCRYFASHADALVILDNVEEPRLVPTVLSDLAGGVLPCTILYTSRQHTTPAGATLYAVEPLSEEGALHLLLVPTRPALLAEVLAGSTSVEALAARTLCRDAGYLPLALTHLQGLLEEDRQMRLHDLAQALRQRGALALAHPRSDLPSLEETFQLSWQQVRDERARQFFLLASLFPEAAPIPLWLLGLATGLGESARPFEPLWEVSLHVQELSLLEALSGEQVRLHPLVRAFGHHLLMQEGEQGRTVRSEAGQRLLAAFSDLAWLEQRARRIGYHTCLEQVRAARDYAMLLDSQHADRLTRLERWLDRESYLLADERWWPGKLPGLFYQQFFNRAVEAGEPLISSLGQPPCWLKQAESVGTEDQALLRIFAGHTAWVTSVAFSPDGRFVLTGSADSTARLWETSSGKALATLQGHTHPVQSVAFSPDGRFVLTGSDDSTARLWETSSGKALATLRGHTHPVQSVAFSPDGRLVLTTGSADKTARLWETSSGKALATLQGHTSMVASVTFSPDGQVAVIYDMNGWVSFWRVPGLDKERPLGLYVATSSVEAVFWQDATHLLLADTGGARGRPYVYRLSLEGPGWKEVERAG